MATCASCGGRGTLNCSSCGGRRFTNRITNSGDLDQSPCAACGGKGHTTCPFCGGRGNVGPDYPTPGSARPGGTAAKREDVLAGRWHGPQGTSYEFVKRGQGYGVVEYGVMGRTGAGSATLAGNIVSLTVNNILFGTYTIQFRLDRDSLRGALNIMGIPTPMVLTRG
jgi:hypothetical protein